MVVGGGIAGTQAALDLADQGVKTFVVEKSPLLVISAHIHESMAIGRLGESVLFYPGPFMRDITG